MAKSTRIPPQTELTLIGPGAAGSALAAALKQTRRFALTIAGRPRARDRQVAKQLGVHFITSLAEINHKHRIILVCVRDGQIDEIVSELMELRLPWRQMRVLHLSGACGAEPLRPLARRGAAVAAWHPYQTFPRGGKPATLRGVTFGIDGNSRGIAAAFRLTRLLGGIPVRIPARMRPLYHASAVFASGFVTANLAAAVELLVKCGLTTAQARRAATTIAGETLANISHLGPTRALTGPAVRGDAATVRRHIAALRTDAPEWLRLYREQSKIAAK